MAATLADIQRKYGESVYPLYKDQMHEPYMENENGNGYKGVVLHDEPDDKIQCAVCGNWYENVGTHLRYSHYITAKEYKLEFGLNLETPLVSPGISGKMSNRSKSRKSWKNLVKQSDLSKESKAKMINARRKAKLIRSYSIQTMNKIGSCDAQTVARLQILSDLVKRSPTFRDFRKYDWNLYGILVRRYGTLNKGKKALGYETYDVGAGARIEDSVLLGSLRKFVIENKRDIYQKDCVKHGVGFNIKTFVKHFGSWRRAKMMAGLNQLLEEIKLK